MQFRGESYGIFIWKTLFLGHTRWGQVMDRLSKNLVSHFELRTSEIKTVFFKLKSDVMCCEEAWCFVSFSVVRSLVLKTRIFLSTRNYREKGFLSQWPKQTQAADSELVGERLVTSIHSVRMLFREELASLKRKKQERRQEVALRMVDYSVESLQKRRTND